MNKFETNDMQVCSPFCLLAAASAASKSTLELDMSQSPVGYVYVDSLLHTSTSR